MKIAISKSRDPYINLATEEVILKDESIQENMILFYINDNTIVIGRNQNAYEEINSDFVKENNIQLIRRVSGGGAVYHDTGNINFSFITGKGKGTYAMFLEPIIEFLKSLGLDAKFVGKNDLHVNDAKVSGNAQYVYKDKMFHHGTLLFDADLTKLGSALKPNKLKMESKGIKSARQRVINIRTALENDMTPEEFFKAIINYFTTKNDCEDFELDGYKEKEIAQLASVRKSHDWTYVKNPKFTIKNEARFSGGTISVLIETNQNKIEDIAFFGDFLSKVDSEEINKIFIGNDFTDENIKEIINNIEEFDNYFGKITKEELINLVLSNEN